MIEGKLSVFWWIVHVERDDGGYINNDMMDPKRKEIHKFDESWQYLDASPFKSPPISFRPHIGHKDTTKDWVNDYVVKEADNVNSHVILCTLNGDTIETILVHKRSTNVGLGKGKLGFPGGEINEGETIPQGLLRELKEECLIIDALPKETDLYLVQASFKGDKLTYAWYTMFVDAFAVDNL